MYTKCVVFKTIYHRNVGEKAKKHFKKHNLWLRQKLKKAKNMKKQD